jgi:hypothetical protein
MIRSKETLELIQRTAVDAAGCFPVDVGDERKQVFWSGGKFHEYIVKPPRKHETNNLESFINYFTDQKIPEMALNTTAVDPVIWINEKEIVGILDNRSPDREDQIRMPLNFNKKFQTLQEMSKEKKSWSQNQFILFLKYDLELPATFYSQFRRLQFDSSSKATSVRDHGDNRLGREISEQVSGVDKLPDEINIVTWVFDNVFDEAVVKCGIEIDTSNQQFFLVPYQSEIEKAQNIILQNILDKLIDRLQTKDYFVPIYRGSIGAKKNDKEES